FVVDDNFIGNKAAAGAMLHRLADWNRKRRHPFDFFTEASVNLAADDRLITAMVEAGFTAVFLGIETPSREALLATGKRQNTHFQLAGAVEKITASGLDVMAGFIVGFDSDDADIFERQHEFIAASPVSMAMVGMLMALPGTRLWRRLEAEQRLHTEASGDNLERPNFATRLPEQELVRGYAWLLQKLYEPRAYFERALAALRLMPQAVTGHRRSFGFAARTAWRSVWKQGVRGRYRREYWRFLWKAITESPHHLTKAFSMAVVGEHMIRYTREVVLPRLQATLTAPPSPAGA
ncbi:MAG: B12-binding domain-containing radical SAM protein, partial [Planctomycetota bacterium]